MIASAIVVALFAVAGADEAPTVAVRIDRGVALLDAMEVEAAAAELAIAAGDPRATLDERVRANLHAGIANRILGRDVEARLHFTFVLKHAPETTLPPGTSPKIETFFELVRQEVELSRAKEVPSVAPADTRGGLRVLLSTGVALFAASALGIVGAVVVGTVGELAAADPSADAVARQAGIYAVWVSLGVGALAALGVVTGATLFAVGVVE